MDVSKVSVGESDAGSSIGMSGLASPYEEAVASGSEFWEVSVTVWEVLHA
jgi:hypothetical protein